MTIIAKRIPNEILKVFTIELRTNNINKQQPTDCFYSATLSFVVIKSLELFFKNYSNFSGRSSRSSFLWFQLLDWVVILTVLELVDVMLHNNDLGYYYHPDFGGLLGITWSVVTLVPNISLVVRRLHDTNRSGWWLLLSFTIIGIIPLIVWFCSSGTKGKNIYGPDKEAGL